MNRTRIKLTAAKAGLIGALLAIQPVVSSAAEDLLTIYQQAQQTDPQISAAEAVYQSEVEGISIARGGLLPQISASASLSKSKGTSDTTSRGKIDYYEDGDTATLSLEQALFRKDLWEELNKAELVTARAETQLTAAQQDLIVRVAEAYFNVLAERDNLAFSTAEKGSIESQLRQATKKREVGLGAVTDVKETRAQRDIAKAQELRARNNLNIALQRLHVIAGKASPNLKPLLGTMSLNLPSPNDMDIWENEASQKNLTLLASEMQVMIAKKSMDIADAQRLPTVSLTGQVGRDNTDNFKLGDDRDNRNTIALNLRMPIYTGGRTSGAIRRAFSQVNLAESQYDLQKRVTLAETREAFFNQVFSVSHAASLRQALASTRSAHDATKAGYNVGTRTAVDVLLALKETYRAQRDYSRSRYDYALNWLKLKRAAGTLGDADIIEMNTWF